MTKLVRALGTFIDKDDRELIGRAVVAGCAAVIGIVMAAAALGLAVSVFQFMRGI